ncbi:SRPBCC family protein [Streptomyces sp. NPDC047515]|uniref:SRPBCC family protein n=1 Tax=Streptomyces sp. NPDC047515 TaxID=3155380 RepID=UPI00340B11D1
MHMLQRSAVITATPDEVWRVIGDFGGLADWHPQVPPSTIEDDMSTERPGAVRAFAIDGKVLARERLLALDAGTHSYTYTVIDPVPAVSDYVATLAVHPHADGAEVRWSATYESADDVVPQVESLYGDGTYGTGLTALAARFA